MSRARSNDDAALDLFAGPPSHAAGVPPRATPAPAADRRETEGAAPPPPPTPEPAPAPFAVPAAPASETAPSAAGGSAADRILAGLNDAQRAAVTHGEGPVLIVAGAGTGKTQVITRRIAWLIAAKKARPDEILALTFTEKAAAEMEARVDELIPYGLTGSTICTFHAFGDRMLREHAVELGLTTQLRVEGRAEILVFLREHLFELGLERYLPLGRPDEHLDALVTLFDRARDEDVSPAQYLEFAEKLVAEARGDDARDRAEMELEKARAYGAYQELILREGRIDFGSQIGLALRLLRERPWLGREYGGRYRYVLVDEFQDTNHVQFELLRRLAGPRANLTVVGDDDQSIYRFRGAKIENLLGFRAAYPNARLVLLTENYRSGQRILDFAHRLIQHNNPARLEAMEGIDKRLIAHRGVEGIVEQRAYRNASEEADAVADEIEQSIAAGTLAAGDIAVLARAHFHLDPFAAALKARGVPFQRSSTRGLYGRTEVRLCLDVLRAVADPGDGPAVHQVLAHPLYGVDPVDLARLSAHARRRNTALLRVAAGAARDASWELTQASREAIERWTDLHRRLSASAVHRPTTEVLYEFAAESGILESLATADSLEAVEQAKNLNKLFHIAARIGPLLQHDRVDQFITHLDLLIEAGDDPAQAEVELDEDAVHLLTAHNGKGLEFPVVYMVQLAEFRFPGSRRGETIALPSELMRGAVDVKADHEREERRLFYVGMTRARDRLVLTGASDYGGKMLRKTSRFVMEALALSHAPRPATTPSAMQSIARYAPGTEPPVPEMQPLADDAPLTVSHHQIDDYLTCPLKYRYAHLAQIPLQRDARAMFGIAIHHAIKIFHRHRIKGLPITADDVIGAFVGAWSSEGFYTREHEERRQEEGRAMLRRLIEREEKSGVVPLAIEMDFRFAIGPTVVAGRFDRIDERADGIVLVDYKTAELEEVEKADQRAAKSLEEEQLGIYALAYFETRGVMPARVELSFVESGLVGSAEVEPRHLEQARERIASAAAGIRSARFPAQPDPRRCRWCPYSRFCPSSALRPGGNA